MLDDATALPDDPVAIVALTNGATMATLRAFAARLLAEVKAQAILIEKLRHQLACAIVSRTNGETRRIIAPTGSAPPRRRRSSCSSRSRMSHWNAIGPRDNGE